jgi:BlaI family penicillinase repressor
MPEKPLTPLELEIMHILWDAGPATVSEVQPKLKSDLAYTTVMTMLNVLLRKGKVKRVQDGRAFRYRPAVTRRRATGSAVEDLVKRMFGGSTEALLLSLVDARRISSKDLDRLSQEVAAAERRTQDQAHDEAPKKKRQEPTQ